MTELAVCSVSDQKWQDIIKEVKFLQKLRHPNTIEYRGCYLKEHTAWVRVMSSFLSTCWPSTRQPLVQTFRHSLTSKMRVSLHRVVFICLSLSWWWSTASARPRTSSKVGLSAPSAFFSCWDYLSACWCSWIFSCFLYYSSQKATPGNRNSCYYPWCTAGISISSFSQYDSQVRASFSDFIHLFTPLNLSDGSSSHPDRPNVTKCFWIALCGCRDVKAGNILLTEPGQVKLGDFGSASIVAPANSFVGTPYWWVV